MQKRTHNRDCQFWLVPSRLLYNSPILLQFEGHHILSNQVREVMYVPLRRGSKAAITSSSLSSLALVTLGTILCGRHT
jgi:hypothetical protein